MDIVKPDIQKFDFIVSLFHESTIVTLSLLQHLDLFEQDSVDVVHLGFNLEVWRRISNFDQSDRNVRVRLLLEVNDDI